MDERKPLAGWRNTFFLGGGQVLRAGPYLHCGISNPLFPPESVTSWSVGVEAATGSVNLALGRCMSHDAARFAAEDAARALVADMAAALGGRVVWDAEGGGE